MLAPPNLKELGVGAFRECRYLKKAVLNEGLEVLPDDVFFKAALESVALPSTLRVLGHRAFQDCKRLKRAQLPRGLQQIGISCFEGSGIEEVTLPTMQKGIYADAFKACDKLKSVWVEDSCNAFLCRAGIPPSAKVGPLPETMIGGQRLWDLRNLKDVVIPEGAERIGHHWFYGSAVESVVVSASV